MFETMLLILLIALNITAGAAWHELREIQRKAGIVAKPRPIPARKL